MRGGSRELCGEHAEPDMVDLKAASSNKLCEDCGLKTANNGLAGESKRWCAPCGKQHGAVRISRPAKKTSSR